MSDELIERFIVLSQRKKDLEKEVEEIEEELEGMEDPLREWFVHTGTKELERHGSRLLLERKVEIHPKEGYNSQDVCRVLISSGNSELVNDPKPSYHWTRLPALWKSAERGETQWPDDLDAITNVKETWVPKVKAPRKG